MRCKRTSLSDKGCAMRTIVTVAIAASAVVLFGPAHAAEKQKSVCLKVNGEKIEINNL